MRATHWTLILTLVVLGFLIGREAVGEVALDAKTMKVALHTATPEEEGFIEYVLAKVAENTLPLELVQSTFLWAKKKPRRKFQYFKYGLTYRAKQQGIAL